MIEIGVSDDGCQALASALRHCALLDLLDIGSGHFFDADYPNQISHEATTTLVASLPQGMTALFLGGLANPKSQDCH